MHSESFEVFTEFEAELKLKLSESMHVKYFYSDDIIHIALRWVLEELDIYDPYSGITNMFEGTNNVVEGLKIWYGAHLDAVILSMHYLQTFKVNEIIRGD